MHISLKPSRLPEGRLDRTIGRAMDWHRDVIARRKARRLARYWQFVSDRQLRDIGLDRLSVAVPSAVVDSRSRHE